MKLFLFISAISALAFLNGQLAYAETAIDSSKAKLSVVEEKINRLTVKQNKQLNKQAQYREDLQDIRAQLMQAEREQIEANKLAQYSTEKTVQMDAQLIDIRVNRLQSRLQRYEKRQAQSRSQLKDYERELSQLTETKTSLSARILWLQKVELEEAEQAAANAAENALAVAESSKETAQKIQALAKLEDDPIEPVIVQEAADNIQHRDQVNNDSALNIEAVTKPQETLSGLSLEGADSGTWPYLSSAQQADVLFAKKRLEELAALRKGRNQGRAPIDQVEIISSRSFGSEDMLYMGDKIYGLTVNVRSGRQKFVLFDQEFWHTIPKQDDKSEYQILFDVSSLSRPQLYLFKRDLLN